MDPQDIPIVADDQPCPDGEHRHVFPEGPGAPTIGNHHDEIPVVPGSAEDPEFKATDNESTQDTGCGHDHSDQPTAYTPEWVDALFDTFEGGVAMVRELAHAAATANTADGWDAAMMGMVGLYNSTDLIGQSFAKRSMRLANHPLIEALMAVGAAGILVDLGTVPDEN